MLSCGEPCIRFDIDRCREQKQLHLQRRQRKCLHLYHYWMHPEFGFRHGRIRSWFPFTMQICLNGREWLARQMQREGLKFVRRDNCFLNVQDYPRAQALLEQQRRAAWPEWLDQIAQQLNPAHVGIFKNFRASYDWSTLQSEWVTDVVFRRAEALRRLYPKLVHPAMRTFSSQDVLRFLGRRWSAGEDRYGNFQGEVMSDVKTRSEGVRVKHGVNGNTIKIYDKACSTAGSVLRVETTVYQERDFQVYRPKEGDEQGHLSWRPLRRGIADLYRRAEVSQAAKERHLQALAGVDDSTTVEQLVRNLEQPVS